MAKEKGGYFKQNPSGDVAVRYIGIFPGVRVPEAEQVWVEQGGVLKVNAELAERLLAQPMNWELAGDEDETNEPAEPAADDNEDEAVVEEDTADEEE